VIYEVSETLIINSIVLFPSSCLDLVFYSILVLLLCGTHQSSLSHERRLLQNCGGVFALGQI